MTVEPALSSESRGGWRLLDNAPPTRQIAFVFLVAFVVQLIAYHEAFRIRPSADDFILAMQVRVGEQNGPLWFFAHSPLKDYRPLQSVAYWAAGRWAIDDPFPLIHFLNFASFAFYATVVAAWTVLLRMSLGGAICTAVFVALHPILAGPLSDLDGFTRLVVSGWVWLGAYFAMRFANDLRRAILLSGGCLTIGLLFMEYAVGLIPLAVLAVYSARQRKPVAAAAALGVALLSVFGAYYAVRTHVVGSSAELLTVAPLEWARNFAMLLSGVLFMGNTVWVYMNQHTVTYLVLGLAVVLLGGIVLLGLAQRYLWTGTAAKYRELGFLLTAFGAAFTPMVFMAHVSEIYATAIVVPLALMIGRAAEGWARLRRPAFIGVIGLFVLHIAWALFSVESKVSSLRATGDRAAVQIDQLVRWVPPSPERQKIALVFLERELPERRTYSVFQAGDDHLLQPGYGEAAAIEWLRPGRQHKLTHVLVSDRTQVKSQDYDVVLYWNASSREFERWK
jgi:hypothetical protein